MSSIAPTVASLNDRLLNPRNREGAWLWTKEQAFNYILNMHRVAKSKSRQLGYSGADAPQFEDVNNLMDNVIWRALRAELGEQVIANESTTESPEGEPQSINVTSFIGRTILIGDLWNALGFSITVVDLNGSYPSNTDFRSQIWILLQFARFCLLVNDKLYASPQNRTYLPRKAGIEWLHVSEEIQTSAGMRSRDVSFLTTSTPQAAVESVKNKYNAKRKELMFTSLGIEKPWPTKKHHTRWDWGNCSEHLALPGNYEPSTVINSLVIDIFCVAEMRSVDSDFPDRIFTKLCRYCQEMVRKSRQPLHDRADNKLYNTRDLPQESRAAHQPNLSQSSAQQLASLRDLQPAAASSSREPPEVAAARGSSSPSSLGATGAHTTDASTSQTRRRRETRETSRTLAGAQGSSRSRQPPSTDATDPAIAATRSNAPTDFTSKSMSSTPSVSQAHHQQSYPVQAGHPVGTQQQSVQRTRPPSTSQPASSQYSAYTSSHTSTVPFTSSQRAGDASGILQPGTVHDDRSRMGSQVLPQSQQARHHAPAPLYRFGSIDPGVEPSSHSGQASAQNASLVPSAQYTPGAVRQRASEQGIPPIPSAQAAHPERRMHVNPGVSSASASVSASIFAHHPLPSAVLTSGTSTYSPQQQQPGFYPSSTVAAGPSGPFNAHPGSSSHAGALHLGTSQGPASTNPTNVGSFPNLQQQFYNQNAGRTLHDMTTLANALPAVPTSSSTSHTASYPPQRQIVVPPQSHGRPPLPPGQPQHNAANQYHPSSTRPPPSGNNYYNSAR